MLRLLVLLIGLFGITSGAAAASADDCIVEKLQTRWIVTGLRCKDKASYNIVYAYLKLQHTGRRSVLEILELPKSGKIEVRVVFDKNVAYGRPATVETFFKCRVSTQNLISQSVSALFECGYAGDYTLALGEFLTRNLNLRFVRSSLIYPVGPLAGWNYVHITWSN